MDSKPKQIVPELIWMRSIACLAVVLLHAAGEFLQYGQVPPGATRLTLTTVSALVLFATPTFAFMSAFLIGFSRRKQNRLQILWTRVKYLLLPFICFAVVYAAWGAYNWHFPFLQRLAYNLKGGYHGYFILIVLQFYLAHALLEPLLTRLRPRYALAGGALINLLYLLVLDLGLLPLPSLGLNLYLLFPAWLCYYVLGFYMGRHREQARALLQRYIGWIGAFTAAAAAGLLYEVLKGARPALTSQRFEVLLYAAGAICLAFYFAGRRPQVPAILSQISRYSFGIYLWHWFFIELLWRLAHSYLTLVTSAGIAALWAASIAGSVTLTYLLQTVKIGHFLVGKPGVTAADSQPEAGQATSLLICGAVLYWLAIKQLWMMQALGIQPDRKMLLFTLAPTLALVSPALWLKGRRQVLAALPQPFQAMVITVSSHAPYAGNGIPHRLGLGALEGTETGDYLQTIHYVDAAIGTFIGQLKQSGLLDRSVLAVYGDHTILTRETPGLAGLLGLSSSGDDLGWAAAEHQVPFLVRLPGGQPALRSDPAGEIDIAPTVAGLLGVPTDKAYFMGRDLFESDSGTVVLHDGSTITADRAYLAEANALTGARYDRRTGSELPGADCSRRADEDIFYRRG